MKNFFILYAILLFSDCTPEDFVRDNSRTLVVGNVVTENGMPIQNISITSAYAINSLGDFENFKPSDFDPVLGASQTDSNGAFSFTSLSPENTGRLSYFQVNSEQDSPLHNVIYILDIPFSGLVELPETTLRSKSQLEINIQRTSPEPTNLFYSLEYINSCELRLLSDTTSQQQSTFLGEVGPLTDQETMTFDTVVGETAVFFYRIFTDDGILAEGTEIITINQSSQTFSFEL